MSKLSKVRAAEFENSVDLWQDVVNRSSVAWYRHSHNLLAFHKSVAAEKKCEDHSFFIIHENNIVGLCPLLIMQTPQGYKDLSYNGSPTPWPCFVDDTGSPIQERENYAFENILDLCTKNSVDRAVFGLNSPSLGVNAHKEFHAIADKFRFADCSFFSHVTTVCNDSFLNIRNSYRRNIRKFRKKYNTAIYIGDDVTDDIEDAYFKLHVKDAGGQFRSRESYTKMADLARLSEAAFIVARSDETGEVVGVLVIAVFKGAAYDSSVSIDPDHASNYISHLLKAHALEFLAQRNIEHYELGKVSNTASFFDVPTYKERNISFFKDGFARGTIKTSYVAEKYFNKDMLDDVLEARKQKLYHYFELDK